MGERFQRLIKQLGFKSNVAFAEKIKSSEGKVRDIIKGRVKTLSPEILDFLISKNVNLNWLFTGIGGEGGMFLGTFNTPTKGSGLLSDRTLESEGNGGNATNRVKVRFDENGLPITEIIPVDSKKPKTKSADVVSLEGLTERQKKAVIEMVNSYKDEK